MIFQVSNKIKVMNQFSLLRTCCGPILPSSLLNTRSSFSGFPRKAKFEKSYFTPIIISRKLRVLTFQLWNPTLITKNVLDMN